MWGDNYAGQLGQGDDVHRDHPVIVKSLIDTKVVDVSCGYQHSLILDSDGTVYGAGKNNKYQLGKDKKAKDEGGEIMDKYGHFSPIGGFNVLADADREKGKTFNEPIVQMKAGKQHSLFLSSSGTVYSLGFNLHGQTGLSTYLFPHVETPTEIPTDGLKIKQIATGFHHNLLLDEEGRIYGFGSLTPGKVETLHEITLPSNSKVTRIHSSNMRN